MATTGTFWDLTDPLKPFGLFDPDGVYDFPLNWADWLADIGDTYASHQVICDPALTCPASDQASGVITVRIEASGAPALAIGKKYPFTVRITTTNGQVEDQTLWLKVIEK
jgi:hypothetical protein